MKILIADKLSPAALTSLDELGAIVTSNPDLSADDIPGAIGDSEVLIVRSTKVTKAAIESAPALSLIIRAGAGVNTIDIETASKRGIHIANCPGKNSDAVAELAIGLLIAADRRIVAADVDLRNGQWKKKEYGVARGLKGRTLGVIGIGNIGKGVIRRAFGLDMKVIGWSRSLTPEKAAELGIGYCKSPLAVAEQADAVSIHIAANSETAHMINAEFLAKMKDGAILVNASRGEVVDTKALKEAINKKGLRVALDVFENEPKSGIAPFEDTEIATLATCTPHIGASTDQAAEAIATEAVSIVASYKEGGLPRNVVNIRNRASTKYNLIVRHFNKVGVLAGVLDRLRDQNVNIEEMQNTIFNGGHAAICTLKLDSNLSDELVVELNDNKEIIHAELAD
jgi:D-3-phosphoglycerate dehydrogenase